VVKWAGEKLDDLRRRLAGELRAAGRGDEAATLGTGMWALRKDQRKLTPPQRGTLAQIAVVSKPLYKGYLIKGADPRGLQSQRRGRQDPDDRRDRLGAPLPHPRVYRPGQRPDHPHTRIPQRRRPHEHDPVRPRRHLPRITLRVNHQPNLKLPDASFPAEVVLALQCRYQGRTRWMGCGGMGDGAGGLPSLADTIAAVRRELSAGLAPGGEQLARFRAGPVELDFGIAVTWTGGGADGVQLSVLTLDSPGTATQRIKVTLQPSAGVGQAPAALSAAEDGLPEYPARAAGLEVLEVADGLMVYQADPECVHHLNNTASIVFELCDGENTVPEISEQLAAVFGLDGVPAGTAEECIADLWSKSIIL
jgi:hypothetical protein